MAAPNSGEPLDFTIIIPTYKRFDLLKNLLHSLRTKETKNNYEILVVSDAVIDPSLEKCCKAEGARLIVKEKRSGYSASINVGFKEGKGRYFLVLNDDMLILTPFLDFLKNIFQTDPTVGLIGAKLLYPNNTIQHAGVIWIPGANSFQHRFGGQPRHFHLSNISGYCIACTGAFMAISRTAKEKIGLFPERYFMTCEDTEYCLRMWENGLRVYYASDVILYHLEGATRGATVAEKNKIDPHSYLHEVVAIKTFHELYPVKRVQLILDKIRQSNIKLLT